MQQFGSDLVFILLFGLSYGLVLFICAIGLVITMGLMHVMNLAHGAFAALHDSCGLRPGCALKPRSYNRS